MRVYTAMALHVFEKVALILLMQQERREGQDKTHMEAHKLHAHNSSVGAMKLPSQFCMSLGGGEGTEGQRVCLSL